MRSLLVLILGMSLFAAAGGSTQARAEPLSFSDSVLPFDKMSEVMWKPLWTTLPEKIYKQFGQQIAPNGDTTFVDSTGSAVITVQVSSVVNESGTQRYVSFRFYQSSAANFLIEVKTEGTDLVAPPIDQVRLGRLPFFPSKDNERFTEVTITNTSGNFVNFRLVKETVGETQFLSVNMCLLDHTPVMTYREESGPGYREFTYTLKKGMIGRDLTLGAVKRKTDGMLIGSESFFVNGITASFTEFVTSADLSIVPFATSFINF